MKDDEELEKLFAKMSKQAVKEMVNQNSPKKRVTAKKTTAKKTNGTKKTK